jgi:16S rRNA processing protein RimM
MEQAPDLRVGKITTTHGVRGEVRVISTTDYPEVRFAKGAHLLCRHPQKNESLWLTVERSRPHKQFYLLTFVEWDHIDQAEAWIGSELYIPQEEAIPNDEDEFYYHEIIGCHVQTLTGESIGKVKEILPNPANDIWVVERVNDKDLYIPFIREIVKEVDIDRKQVLIEWMEGLD